MASHGWNIFPKGWVVLRANAPWPASCMAGQWSCLLVDAKSFVMQALFSVTLHGWPSSMAIHRGSRGNGASVSFPPTLADVTLDVGRGEVTVGYPAK